MTESEAYDIAIAHLNALGITFHCCFSRGFRSDCEMRPGPLGEHDLPKGLRRKIWGFAFAFEEVPPNVIVSGNGCVVPVDDETGMCSFFASL